MNFFIQLIISLAISILLAPKIGSQNPPSEDDLEFPTIDETRNIPVIYGTVRIDGPNHIYAGQDFRYEEMSKEVGGFAGIGAEDVTLGYKYFITCLVAIGFGECSVKQIFFNDHNAYTHSENLFYQREGLKDDSTIIEASQLFMTEQDEAPYNGVAGYVYVWSGKDNDYDPAMAQTGGGVSPLKGLCYVSFFDFYWGNSRTLPAPSFVVTRFPNQVMKDDKHVIHDGYAFWENYDCNPVEILYDIMTNIDYYGVGIPANKIDIDSFREAGEILFTEEFGLSLTMENGATFDDIRKDILKHIDGNLFMSPYTGKWTLTLNRGGYVLNDLLVLDKTNIKQVAKYSKKETSALKTEVKINFKDRYKKYQERNVSAKSLTILKQKGGIPDVYTDDFFAVKKSSLAAKIATREMKAWSYPLLSLELVTLRAPFGLRIGDVVRVNYVEGNININDKVFRVVEMDFGQFNKNEIRLNLVEDIFSFGDQAVAAIGETKYVPPEESDLDFEYRVNEAPIFYGQTHNALVAVGKHSNRAKGFDLLKQETTAILQEARQGLVPYGFLKFDIDKLSSSMVLELTQANRDFNFNVLRSATSGDRLQGSNMLYITDGINEEYMSYSSVEQDVNFNNLNLSDLWRGGLDTQPKKWLAGATVYFISHNVIVANLDPTNTNGQVITYDLEKSYNTITPNAFIVDDANIAFNNRFLKPFLPNNLQINGVKLGETIPIGDLLSLSWNHNDRKAAVANFTWFDNETITQEDFTVYNLYIYDDQNNLIKTELGLTGTTYDFVDEAALGGLFPQLRIVLETERTGILSNEKYDITIVRI